MEQTPASPAVQGGQDAAPTQPASAMSQQPRVSSVQPNETAAQSSQPAPYYVHSPPAPVAPFDKNWHWAKMALTAASVVFSIIIMGLALGIALRPGASDSNAIYGWISVPVVVACIIWDLAELITVVTCGRPREQQQQPNEGIHPGAHVGVDLILWMGGLVVLLLTIPAYLNDGYISVLCDTENYYPNSYYDRDCSDDYLNSVKNFYLPAQRSILAFLCLLVLTHFAIFVRACIETNQRNRMRAPVVMVPTSQHMSMMYYGGPPQPGMMPAMPPQTHMGPRGQGYAAAEKASSSSSAAANPQGHATQQQQQQLADPTPAEGYYAPNLATVNRPGQAV